MTEQFWKMADHYSKMVEFAAGKIDEFTVALENGRHDKKWLSSL
jgi:hypothetical protein